MNYDNLSYDWFDGIRQEPEYREAVDRFCEWIDHYKKNIKWDNIFNTGSPHYARMGWHDPKFHDLPLELQAGILLHFFGNRDVRFALPVPFDLKLFKSYIKLGFVVVSGQIEAEKKKEANK